MVKDTINLSRRRGQVVEDRIVCEQGNNRSNEEFGRGYVRPQGAHSVDMGTVARKPDFLVRLTVLGQAVLALGWGKMDRVLTAVSKTSASVTSTLPPGRATWPGCARRDLSRVVRRTRNSPALSNKSTSTAASLPEGYPDLRRLFMHT